MRRQGARLVRAGRLRLTAIVILMSPMGLQGQTTDADGRAATGRILPKLIKGRHDLHRHPELSNRETRTAGASPHLGIDAIVTASQIVSGLQTIRSRTLSPFEPAVVTVGVFQAGDRRDIIAGEAYLEGTVRTFSDSTTALIKARMREIFGGVTAAAGAEFELTFEETIPVTVNDTMLARRAHPVLERTAGAENVGIVAPETGAEDFSYFAPEVPSCYFKLGAVRPDHASDAHHTPTFRADDEAIPVGVRAMTAVVLEALAAGS